MIASFFENKEIFITGGSGVLGTAVLEQLLRLCNVRKIYLLLRPKKSISTQERLEKLKGEAIFRQLKIKKPNELDEKLVAVPGEATLPLLGITSDWSKLMENVTIVFHCAATVRFDESLRDAVKLNVGGTLETLRFAETLKKLQLFMHVSTFFSNPYLKYVEPKFYEAPMDWKLCLKLTERDDISEEQVDIITKKLITGFPNTYTFTKNLAESLVNDYKDRLPVSIYRPSIVFFALEQPEPGFSPSLMGLVGLYAVTGAGILKTFYLQPNARLDIVPQDICVINMLYYTIKASQMYEKSTPSDIPVFLSSSCTILDFTLMEYVDIMENFGLWKKHAFEKNLLLPGVYDTNNRLIYMFLVFFLQIIPSLLVDFVLILTGRRPTLMRLQRKVFRTLEAMKPFMFNIFYSPGITACEEMRKDLENTDFKIDCVLEAKDLHFNVGACDKMIAGMRKHLFKEDPKTIPRSRKIFQIKVWLSKCMRLYVGYKLCLIVVEYGSKYLSNWQMNSVSC